MGNGGWVTWPRRISLRAVVNGKTASRTRMRGRRIAKAGLLALTRDVAYMDLFC